MTIVKNIDTIFKDVKCFQIRSFNDERGSFREVYNKEILDIIGSTVNFIQDNESHSIFGTLRGLHFQNNPYAQSKLIRVSLGILQDVIVDIRVNSDTYGQWESYEISRDNNRILFVPRGFAHGFLVLSQGAVVNYKVDNYYDRKSDSGIAFNDSTLNIKWELPHKDIILSDKVLDIDPDRISALTNKAISLKMLKEYEESHQVFTKILTLDPDNKKIKQARASLLSESPTISTNNSMYEVHVLVTVRDKDEYLIAVTESNNARYLPSEFTEKWWNSLSEKNYLKYNDGNEIFQKENTILSSDDHLGVLTLEREMNG